MLRTPSTLPLLASLALACACSAPPTGSDAPDRTEPAAVEPAHPMLGGVDEATFKALHQLELREGPELRGEEVAIEVAELGPMGCYLALPPGHDGGSLPSVVVIHEWWGLNDNVRLWTDRIAAEGYAALAVDLYEGVVATDSDTAYATMVAVDENEAKARLAAAHAWLGAQHGDGGQEPSACIGWCFGGGWSLTMGLEQDGLDGAVIYYGRREVDEQAAAATEARLLGIYGERDRSIGPDYVAALSEQLEGVGVDFTHHIYPANHAFANPSNSRYDEVHAAEAWERTRTFLAEVLGAE